MATGRPGPVLVDIPKDVQQALIAPNWDEPMNLPGYNGKSTSTLTCTCRFNGRI